MSELGRLLAEARAAKELSLADVEKATRIRQKYLEALENGDFASLPRGTVARGFLRTYALYLDLDPDDALRRYVEESGDTDQSMPIADVGKPRLVDYRPVEVELMDTRPSLGWVRWVVALVVVAVIAGAAWWYLNNQGISTVSLLAALGPATTSTPTTVPLPTPTLWIVTATPTMPPQGAAAATPTSDLLPLPTPTVPPTVTPTPRPTATPEVVARISLTAVIDQTSWLRVTADDQVVLEALLDPGTTQTWEANNSLKVLTGNGAEVTISLNGAELGKMGGVGQVIERTWVVDQGQVTEREPQTGTPSPTPTRAPTPSG